MGIHFAGSRGPASDWRGALAAVPPGGLAVFSPAPFHRGARRIARALLEDAAVLGGGQVLTLAGGDLLVVATAGPGHRAAAAIQDVCGVLPEIWSLPEQLSMAEAHCEGAAAVRPEAVLGLTELEVLCGTLAIEAFAQLTLFAEGPSSRPVAQRLGPVSLGLADPDMEAVAREALCRRLLTALTDPMQRVRLPSLRPGLPLILDLPLGALSNGAPMRGGVADDPNGPIALLPLAALSDAAGFRTMQAGLRAAGWRVGILATHPAVLAWVAAPGLIWAVPAKSEPLHAGPPPAGAAPDGLIVLGQPVPEWCLAPGIWHEGCSG